LEEKVFERTQTVNLKNLNLLSSAFEQTADHVFITDSSGIILYVNPAFEETTGYTKEEAVGQTPRILKSGIHDAQFYKKVWSVILKGRTFKGTFINRNKNGNLCYADQTITPIADKSGKIIHFISIWKDVTERIYVRDTLNRLHESVKFEKQKLEQILNFGERIETINNFNKLIDFIIEQASSILDSERCSLMLLDEDTGELCIRGAIGLSDDIIKNNKVGLGEGIAGLVAKEGRSMRVEVVHEDDEWLYQKPPAYKTKSFLSAPIKLDDKLIGVVNVTDKKNKKHSVYTELDLKILLAIVRQAAVAIKNAQLSKELKYLTIIDPLTSLYNYRHLMECLAYEIKRFKRFNRPVCLLMMDVDDFKSYNDRFGYTQGDMLLKKISEALRVNLRESDLIFRYAGDEFIVILPETDAEETKNIAEKIRESVKKTKFKRPVTLSMGIAKCMKGMDRHDFIAKAEAGVQKAKKDGKDRIFCTCFVPVQTKMAG